MGKSIRLGTLAVISIGMLLIAGIGPAQEPGSVDEGQDKQVRAAMLEQLWSYVESRENLDDELVDSISRSMRAMATAADAPRPGPKGDKEAANLLFQQVIANAAVIELVQNHRLIELAEERNRLLRDACADVSSPND